uniref:RlpA-like double-psi beta-barrel domain-containing protein n=1 Tax=Legionella tunisiensis TaxID=1034944 RepID=UPI0002FA5F11
MLYEVITIVKVNDRGPFHSDRVIDLSYAAAIKLGLLPKGTAPVEIEALNTGKHVARYYVQAGAFNSEKLANLLQNKLAKLTPSPVVIEKHANRFVVKVGPFANKRMTSNLKISWLPMACMALSPYYNKMAKRHLNLGPVDISTI